MSRTRAWILGGLTVGVLDILDPIVFFYLRHDVPPQRVLQSVAAGLLGRDAAVAGGWPTALLGLGLHFFIAFTVVLVYHVASRRLTVLTEHPWVCGLLYGLAVYLVMNYLVLPLSATNRGWWPPLPPWPVLVNGLLIHLLGVGLPSALSARAARRAAG